MGTAYAICKLAYMIHGYIFCGFMFQFSVPNTRLPLTFAGGGYDCKSLPASDVDDDDVASSSHLNLADDALSRTSYAPPPPKPGPSPHPVLGCRPPHQREVDGVQEPQQISPRASSFTGPVPPRDYGRQQAEAAVHPPSRLGKMMDMFRAFLDAYGWQI